MTGRFPPNRGSSEYANIIGGIGNIRQLLDEEFAKKLQSGDLSAVSSAITSGAVTAVGMVSSGVLPGLGPTPVQQLINQLGSSVDDIAQNAGNIVRGGIGGLVSAVKALLGIALKIIGVTFAILMARFFSETEIQRISAIINELLALRDRVTALDQELMGLREITEQGFLAVNNNVITVDSNLREVQSNLARGISMTAGSTTKLIKAESFGVKQAVNTVKTELGSQIEAFQSESRTEWLNNRDWQFNNRAAAVATLTVAGVTAPEGMLDKTFQNPTNIKQTVTNTAVKVQEGFQKIFDNFKSVGSMIDVGRIIDVITLTAVIHNAAMLSSSLSQTLFKVVYNGLNIALDALGVKDIEGEAVDFEKSFIGAFEAIGRRIFGVQNWEALKARWAATNRILSTGSTLLWSVRDLMDNTQTLAEIAAENSAKVGNALRRAGAIFDVGAWFPENYSHRTILHRKLTNLTQFLGTEQNLDQVL